MTPRVKASTGGTTVSFVPSARPAATPATRMTPNGSDVPAESVPRGAPIGVAPVGRRTGQRDEETRATADRKRAIATSSLLALPGCREQRLFAAIPEATA